MKRKHSPEVAGNTFGFWTVVSEDFSRKQPAFLCQCVCGNTSIVYRDNLREGKSTKCRECAWVTHGQSRGKWTAEYRAWTSMKTRCLNAKAPNFRLYGGRGICVCVEWLGKKGFERFMAHVGLRPSALHSLDRYPNKDGNYEPGNVRWATRKQQSRNTNWNRWLTLNGISRTVAEWAETLNIPPNVLHTRIKFGWTVERMLTQPVQVRKARPPYVSVERQ